MKTKKFKIGDKVRIDERCDHSQQSRGFKGYVTEIDLHGGVVLKGKSLLGVVYRISPTKENQIYTANWQHGSCLTKIK